MKNKENNRKTLLWIFKRSKRFLPKVALISGISMADALIFVWLSLVSKKMFDIATGSADGSILKTGLLIFGIIFAHILLTSAQTFLNAYTNAKVHISLQQYLFSQISQRRYSYISHYHSGDLLNRLTSDTDTVIAAVVGIVPSVASVAAKIIGGMSALLVLDKRIALIVLVLGISVPAIGRILNRRYKALHKKTQQTEGKTRAFMQECFENLVVVKSFVSEAPFLRKLDQLMKENFSVKMKRAMTYVITHMGLYSVFTVGYYLIMVWGAGQISAGTITYGTLMAFLQLVSQLRAPLQSVSGILPQYYSALASAERLMEIENGESDIPSVEQEKLFEMRERFSGLQVRDITFAYKDETILKNCSFTAERGKITAITGESGSGKSTVFRLLLGLFEPQAGEITVNGDTKLDTSLRGLFAYVPQGNMILSGTIRENLTLCNDNVSEEELIKATKAAEIYDIIVSLPDGFDTMLSERGGGLSEGQLQRISLARALLTDAPVLLLDEATSALDEATETKVLGNIRDMNGKTVLFVTHRNTSLKVCDKIIHVEDKKFNVIKE